MQAQCLILFVFVGFLILFQLVDGSVVDSKLRKMTLQQKISQMVQQDINKFVLYDEQTNTHKLDVGAAEQYIKENGGLGSMFNSPSGVAMIPGIAEIAMPNNLLQARLELPNKLQNAMRLVVGWPDLLLFVQQIRGEESDRSVFASIRVILFDHDAGPIVMRSLQSTPIHPSLEALGVISVTMREPLGCPTLEKWREWMAVFQNLSMSNPPYVPIIHGIDSLHGATYIYNGTIFPHQINFGAAFNPALMRRAAIITARESRAAGLAWVFAPMVDILTRPIWPRTYETFGEDPLEVSVLGVETILGLQGEIPNHYYGTDFKVAATLKHFIGYSNPRSGQDEAPVWLPDTIALQYFMPSAMAAVKANVASVMSSFGELNGRPIVASSRYLQGWLRDYMRFSGVLVTDFDEVNKLVFFHYAAASIQEAERIALQKTGIDISMQGGGYGGFTADVEAMVRKGVIPESRIEESARRILKMKADLGLFESYQNAIPDLPTVGCVFACESHRAEALEAARESITMLKNENGLLPLSPASITKLVVVGPLGNSLRSQAGGWTVHWQGAYSDDQLPYGTTIYTAIQNFLQENGKTSEVQVLFEPGCGHKSMECEPGLVGSALSAIKKADIVVLCLGETPYTEFIGGVNDIRLPLGQLALAKSIYNSLPSTAKLILVLVEGRPRLLEDLPEMASSILLAYLPGPFGGQAVSDIIFGVVNPSGRLPYTYPKFPNAGAVQYYHSLTQATEVRWEFGAGMSFTNFTYSVPTVTIVGQLPTQIVMATFSVKNIGQRDGMEAVLLFSRHPFSIFPEAKRLRAFQKVKVQKGEEQPLTLSFLASALCDVDDISNKCELHAGEYTLLLGPHSIPFTLPKGDTFPGPKAGGETGKTITLPLIFGTDKTTGGGGGGFVTFLFGVLVILAVGGLGAFAASRFFFIQKSSNFVSAEDEEEAETTSSTTNNHMALSISSAVAQANGYQTVE